MSSSRGTAGLDLVKELAELGGAVAPVALANDPPGRNIEGGEQRCGAMPFGVMAPSSHLAGKHRLTTSSAWIRDLSSTRRTMACSGGET